MHEYEKYTVLYYYPAGKYYAVFYKNIQLLAHKNMCTETGVDLSYICELVKC